MFKIINTIFSQHYTSDRIRNLSREIIFYLIFVIIVTIAILNNMSWYRFTNMMETEITEAEYNLKNDAEKSLHDTVNFEQIWLAIHNCLSDSFVWEYWDKNTKTHSGKNETFYLFLLGVPRIRQVRIRKNTCNIHPFFKKVFQTCYGYYSYYNKDTAPFGLQSSPEWTYHSAKEVGGPSYSGKVGTYEGEGYYRDLSTDAYETTGYLNLLEKNKWIDRQTRAVFLDFTVYNHNINSFFTLKIAFELPPTGGVIITTNMTNAKLISYFTSYDFFILACEIILFFYILYYLVNLVFGIRKFGINYFDDRWNYLEVTIVFLGILYTIFKIIIYIMTLVVLNELNENENRYINFETLAIVHKHFNNICGLLLFLIYVKLFKYIRMSGTLGQLNSTIQKCTTDMLGYLFIFILFFIAYAILGYLLFGGHIENFSSITKSMFTLFKCVHEVFEYDEVTANIYGVIYLVTFAFFIFFLLLNMFLAIINDAYTIVKNELNKEEPNQDTINFFKRGAYRLFSRCKPIQKYFKTAEPPQDMRNILRVLKMAKYQDKEIELLLAKYKINPNIDITDQEVDKFVKDVHKNGYQMYEAVDFIRNKTNYKDIITPQQFLNQNIQLESLERNVKKLQYLINQLSHSKKKRKNYKDQ